MKQLQTFPETINYILLALVIISIILKSMHDVFRYKRDKQMESRIPDKEKLKYYGIMYHWFGFAYLVVPFFITLVLKMNYLQFFTSMLGFIAIYSFLMPFLFNIFTKHRPSYIGRTEATDIWLRENFHIYDDTDPEYEELTAKEIQQMNFRKSLIFVIRFGIFVTGISIFLDFI